MTGPDPNPCFANRYIFDSCFPLLALAWKEGEVGKTLTGEPRLQGTAFLIDRRGLLLTAAHVTDELEARQLALITVGRGPNGPLTWLLADAKAVERHPESDVALIQPFAPL